MLFQAHIFYRKVAKLSSGVSLVITCTESPLIQYIFNVTASFYKAPLALLLCKFLRKYIAQRMLQGVILII